MVEKLRVDLLQREVNVKADGVQVAYRQVRLNEPCRLYTFKRLQAIDNAAVRTGFTGAYS